MPHRRTRSGQRTWRGVDPAASCRSSRPVRASRRTTARTRRRRSKIPATAGTARRRSGRDDVVAPTMHEPEPARAPDLARERRSLARSGVRRPGCRRLAVLGCVPARVRRVHRGDATRVAGGTRWRRATSARHLGGARRRRRPPRSGRAELLGRERRRDRVEGCADRGTEPSSVPRAHDRRDVLGRLQMTIVLEEDEVVARRAAVGGEETADVDGPARSACGVSGPPASSGRNSSNIRPIDVARDPGRQSGRVRGIRAVRRTPSPARTGEIAEASAGRSSSRTLARHREPVAILRRRGGEHREPAAPEREGERRCVTSRSFGERSPTRASRKVERRCPPYSGTSSTRPSLERGLHELARPEAELAEHPEPPAPPAPARRARRAAGSRGSRRRRCDGHRVVVGARPAGVRRVRSRGPGDRATARTVRSARSGDTVSRAAGPAVPFDRLGSSMRDRARTRSACRSRDEPAVVTVGFFDGVHLGHRAVLARTVDAARERGVRVGRRSRSIGILARCSRPGQRAAAADDRRAQGRG